MKYSNGFFTHTNAYTMDRRTCSMVADIKCGYRVALAFSYFELKSLSCIRDRRILI